MIKRIIFDFDGTLAFTVPLCMKCFHNAWEPYVGHKLTDEEIFATFGYNEEGMLFRLMEPPYEAAMADLYKMYKELHPVLCPELFEGIPELLNELKDLVPLDLLTGKGKVCCDISLEHFGLRNFFDIIICGEAEKHHKVDGLRSIMEQTNTKPEELLYIGDAVSDVKACKEVGVTCLSVGWTPNAKLKKLEEINLGLLFHTVADMREYILKAIAK